MKKLLALNIAAVISVPAVADHNTINGMDFGPLAKLVGTWKSVETGGVDVSPGQEGTEVGAGGPAGDTMTLVASKRGIAESEYMTDNATTTGFTMNISISDDTLTYSQTTGLEIYDNAFAHTDSSTLIKVK